MGVLSEEKIFMIKNDNIIIDTNILIYSKIKANPFYQSAFNKLYDMFEENQLYITRQIIREYLNVMTKPDNLKYFINKYDLIQDIEYFQENFIVLDEKDLTTRNLLNLVNKFEIKGRQIHDANIVASMIANNIKNIFTHNVKDFERYNSLINVIPLD